jgi:hypothetical protein
MFNMFNNEHNEQKRISLVYIDSRTRLSYKLCLIYLKFLLIITTTKLQSFVIKRLLTLFKDVYKSL